MLFIIRRKIIHINTSQKQNKTENSKQYINITNNKSKSQQTNYNTDTRNNNNRDKFIKIFMYIAINNIYC